jgi:hypothetical protein
MNKWQEGILQAVNALGGEAALQDIYGDLPKQIEFRETDWRGTKWGGRPAFQHPVRSHVKDLQDIGDLVRVSRAIYAITPKGRGRIGVK